MTASHKSTVMSLADEVKTGSVKVREKAVGDLAQLLNPRNRSTNLSDLGDKAYHDIFESIFSFVLREKPIFYSKIKTQTALQSAASRLSKCAAAVRATASRGVSKIGRKTLMAVVDHITQVLPGPDEGFVPPLLQDYVKALTEILSRPANVELLARKDAAYWKICVDFFLDISWQTLPEEGSSASIVAANSRASPAPTASSARSRARSNSAVPFQGRGVQVEGAGGPLRDSLEGLNHLVSAVNAPILCRGKEIIDSVMRVLKVKSLSLGSMQTLCFSVINTLFSAVEADDLPVALGLVKDALPLMAFWWRAEKASQDELIKGLRNEISRSIFLMHLHIEHLAVHLWDDGVRNDLENLVDPLWQEYSKRNEASRLELSNLTFAVYSLPKDSMQLGFLFGLRPHHVEGESHWLMVQNMANLEAILMRSKKRDATREDGHHLRKKKRVHHGPSPIRLKLKSKDVGVVRTALQLVPFLLAAHAYAADEVSDLLTELVAFAGDKNGITSSWAFLACASCVQFKACHEQKDVWRQIWHLTARSISLQTTSRAACLLLHRIMEADILPYHSLSDDVNNIVTTAEINGPGTLSDASLALMNHLFHERNARLPSASQSTASHIIRWVFSKWTPTDPVYASFHCSHVRPIDFVNLLRVCCGAQPFPGISFSLEALPPGSVIFESWKAHKDIAQFNAYLLLLDHDITDTPTELDSCADSSKDEKAPPTDDSSSSFCTSKSLVLDLLRSKVEELRELCELWSRKANDGGIQISPDRFQSLLSACIMSALLTPANDPVAAQSSSSMETTLSEIIAKGVKAALDSVESSTFIDLILRQVRPCIPKITSSELEIFCREKRGLVRLLVKIMEMIEQKTSASQNHSAVTDLMDLDDEFESQSSNETATSASVALPRQNLQLLLSPRTFETETRLRLKLIGVLERDDDLMGLIPHGFIDTLLALSDDDLLSCQSLLKDLFHSDLMIDGKDALSVIERLGAIVSNAEYQSSEVAQITCLEAINGLCNVWLQDEHRLAERVGDLYNYFVKVCLPANILSSRTQMSLARLLFTLLKSDPEYGKSLGVASCRTSLLSILSQGSLKLKCFIAERIAEIFELYILMIHDEVFVDVLDSLPTDLDDTAGIAFRLFVLSRMACRWPTLLRRCTYHIFEIPGKIPGSTEYATRCLADMSRAMKLESPRDLFRLFSRQLLYTWLESEPLQSIPFSIFGYDSLRELLIFAQAEAIGLATMRRQDDTSAEIAQIIGIEEKELVRDNFATALAYSMVHGAVRPTPDEVRGEERIKKRLGSNDFFESVYINFVDIVALFFDIIDQEDVVERVFSRIAHLRYAGENLEAVKRIAHSPAELPANHQPMFRAKFVFHALQALCQGTEYRLQELWTPALVVSIARKLLSTIHQALGSLHACSVLRKLRILVCLAGPVAMESYCVEMLLNSIRRFITDSECADDALGLTQYLLDGARDYLSQVPSFLAGYALSTLASLKAFLESSQASTTQESQFIATMSKAREFHGWFSGYLQAYSSPKFQSESQRVSFQAITTAAAHVRSCGTAEKGTFEGKLLLEILKDEATDEQLLSESSRQIGLGLLCGDFTIPTTIGEDVVEDDDDAISQAAAVWHSCRAQKLSDNYLAWAGRVVGRSFLASGSIPEGILRESSLAQYQKISRGLYGSEMGLLYLLQDMTTGPDFVFAGLAEATLRTAVSRANAEEDRPLVTACQQSLTESLYLTSQWGLYRSPPSELACAHGPETAPFSWTEGIASPTWLSSLSAHLAISVPKSILLSVLSPVLTRVKGFSEKALPFIVHLVLFFQLKKPKAIRRDFSGALRKWLSSTELSAKDNVKLLINTILYLRTQQYPGEVSLADRLKWLDIDYALAASAASRSGMYKTALLFAELAKSDFSSSSSSSSSPRSSTVSMVGDVKAANLDETLLAIFENIDDPDTYYGLPEDASLSSVLARLEFEKDGGKSLAFRGAQYDSHIRLRQAAADADGNALVKTLGTLGLTGLSHSLLQTQQTSDLTQSSLESTFGTARRLENWNLPVPAASDHHAVVTYKAYQTMQQESSLATVRAAIYQGFSRTMQSLADHAHNATSLRPRLAALAALSEMDELLNIADGSEQQMMMRRFEQRGQWMRSSSLDDVSQILSHRGTTISMLGQHPELFGDETLSAASFRQMEVQSLLLASGIYRYHQAIQESLNISTALTNLIEPCEGLGIFVDAAVNIEVANSLWDHGEMSSSIQILQHINRGTALGKQTIAVSKSDLLSRIGHKISVARLEKPRDIQQKYLEPALKGLGGKAGAGGGKEAGQAFHQFAEFCDQQLQDADGLEDLERLRNLRKAKSDEVDGLESLISSTRDAQLKNKYKHILVKEKQWLALDEQELARVEQTRSEFVRLSLENYLLSLAASDENENDALRFTALWLERSSEKNTNQAVVRHISKVPTHKFARLMSQLTSRLQHQDTPFQKLLMDLVYKICADHPYHGMYQIWSGTKAKAQKQDEVALLRIKATEDVASRLATTESVASIWWAIDKTSKYYHVLAMDKDAKYKSGAKILLKESSAATNLMNQLTKYPIPPPTMHIEVNAAKDYSAVPMISKLEPTMTVASGVSAPKIITAVGTDGVRYKQLVKGGQDDLRQDAIMEQVFSAVSSLLKLHRATQQRNLGIRTYKVLPLTAKSGLIEFVRDTIPLHDFLLPAHERYHPKDMKGHMCRKEIADVQKESPDRRLSTYKRVAERFQPVMRYFFMENFVDPDEWFAKRLAYTRSTAAISMLGHVLGVGDRHGHNILLDTKTGEAVHIDLGIAFEAGRILPVPELVPFRLTRDIVDGMGIAGTEGVFRRCCEFTLDALREEQYSIMTILDVLRYDPLHSWTVSPVRLARLQRARQEDHDSVEEEEAEAGTAARRGRSGKEGNEPSEGDRALEVVRKKLSKALSVTATVNDLINQARDPRNLAVLYFGWAAYA